MDIGKLAKFNYLFSHCENNANVKKSKSATSSHKSRENSNYNVSLPIRTIFLNQPLHGIHIAFISFALPLFPLYNPQILI